MKTILDVRCWILDVQLEPPYAGCYGTKGTAVIDRRYRRMSQRDVPTTLGDKLKLELQPQRIGGVSEPLVAAIGYVHFPLTPTLSLGERGNHPQSFSAPGDYDFDWNKTIRIGDAVQPSPYFGAPREHVPTSPKGLATYGEHVRMPCCEPGRFAVRQKGQ